MRIGRIFYLMSRVVIILGLAMLLPLLCALFYPQDRAAWVFATLSPAVIAAGLLSTVALRRFAALPMRQRDSFLFVTMTWLVAALVGSLPYLLCGTFGDAASAVFESISGFTTTGASAMTDIEAQPHALLLWRSLTQWLGGAGIVMLFVALLQKREKSGEGSNIFRAEFSGGVLAQRVAPRIEDNAKALFSVYLALTVACYIALRLAGLGVFDALNHALTTAATGGFSTRNASVGAFNNPAAEWVIACFLFLCSINFALYFNFFIRRRFAKVLADQELRAFAFIVLLTTFFITYDLQTSVFPEYNLLVNLRGGFFQVASIISTGGFCTMDYDQWPDIARLTLFFVMFFGGCSGSTAASIKVYRWHIAMSAIKVQLGRVFRPTQTQRVFFNGRVVDDRVVLAVSQYCFLFVGLTMIGSFLLTFSGVSWEESFHAALTCITNVGPARGSLGPAGNFSAVPAFGKYVLSFLMLIGRLEIYTVLVLFLPGVWKK